MRFSIRLFFFLPVLFSCTSGNEETAALEGRWKVVEIYSSGLKEDAQTEAFIEFKGDGTYTAILNPTSGQMEGRWNVESGKMKLWQPEIRDMHGTRSVEPYMTTWEMSLSDEWLILEGLPTYNVQHLKLVLNKGEQ